MNNENQSEIPIKKTSAMHTEMHEPEYEIDWLEKQDQLAQIDII